MIQYALLTFAQKINAEDANIPQLASDDVLRSALNIAYFLAGVIGVITIIVGGMMYAGSHGDASSIARAKNLIAYAVVGIVVILSAFAVTNFVIGAF